MYQWSVLHKFSLFGKIQEGISPSFELIQLEMLRKAVLIMPLYTCGDSYTPKLFLGGGGGVIKLYNECAIMNKYICTVLV